jgi:hypothetical protein
MGYRPHQFTEEVPMKSLDQIPAEKLAHNELEIADLPALNEQLELRLVKVSDSAALKQCPPLPTAMRYIDDEGDEENGAALFH